MWIRNDMFTRVLAASTICAMYVAMYVLQLRCFCTCSACALYLLYHFMCIVISVPV